MGRLLTINAGSSSVRLAAYEGTVLARVARAHLASHEAEPREALRAFVGGVGEVGAVAHRVVHGGARLTEPAVIDAAVLAEIERLAALAPLHNPRALAWIRACREAFGPGVPQVAVFDTAFFASLPEVAATYALPRGLSMRLGLRRYGFHGIAHEAMVRRLRELDPGRERVVTLQLGAGASVAAVAGGAPVDTSMGFSPLEGLVMATRSGDVDPGLLLHLQRVEGLAPAALEKLLNAESGLLGLSGESGDMRALLASGAPAARLAIDVYAYRARKYVGAYAAALGGVDAVIFGGGVGEHAPAVRARILDGLGFAGIALDEARNLAATGGEARIDAGRGAQVWALAVDEEALLAEKALAALGQERGGS